MESRLVRSRLLMQPFRELLQLVVELLASGQRMVDLCTERHLRRSVASQGVIGVGWYVENDQHTRLAAPQLQTSGKYPGVSGRIIHLDDVARRKPEAARQHRDHSVV